jgi:CubicO group peptidase (beta-lactamase class C family)
MKSNNPSRIARSIYLAFLLFHLAGCTVGVEQITPTPNVPGVFEDSELEAFVDRFFETQLDEFQIPGLTFAFVREGELILLKGYGQSNLEAGTQFDPEMTKIRVGSVSKLIVATAVMQLVDQGQLDLTTDVNRYLTTFQLSDEFDEPVTLANLLTHSGGFDHPPYWTTLDSSQVLPLDPYLTAQIPPRISPPGEVLAYSSIGYDLAALIVEQVSSVPFTEYVQSNILLPLGMNDSEYLTSPPIPEGIGVGYAYDGRTQVPQPIDYDPGYPSGSFVSTARDMAKFMQAHLEGGCLQDACILSTEAITLMHQQPFTNHELLPGWTYGFTEGFRNGVRLIGHGGAIRGFGSDLVLIPEHDLGYFLSFNEECYLTGACGIVGTFRSQFMDLFFPAETQPPSPYETQTDLSQLTGTYRYSRYPHSSIYETEYAPWDVEVTLSHGNLCLRDVEYQEIAPLVFQEIDGQERIAFRQDDQGNIVYMFAPDTYERLDE